MKPTKPMQATTGWNASASSPANAGEPGEDKSHA